MRVFDNKQLLINCLVGVLLISIPFLTSPDLNAGIELFSITPFKRDLFSHLLLLVFFYVNFYYIIPKFYIRKHWFKLIVLVLFCYLIVLKLPQFVFPYDFSGKFHKKGFHGNKLMEMGLFSRSNYFFQFMLAFFLSLYLKMNQYIETIKNEKLLTEVSYLKAQINPHFLFNTLNSVYALALKKSDDAPNAILKLSGMMRYVVSKSNEALVSLNDEIAYISDYINLQKLRLTDEVHLDFTLEGTTENKKIAPLLLITFIENAFKYASEAGEATHITITIKVTDNLLLLMTENTFTSSMINSIEGTHQGQINTKKRLELLYPDKHQLQINKTKNLYQVQLQIQLD